MVGSGTRVCVCVCACVCAIVAGWEGGRDSEENEPGNDGDDIRKACPMTSLLRLRGAEVCVGVGGEGGGGWVDGWGGGQGWSLDGGMTYLANSVKERDPTC